MANIPISSLPEITAITDNHYIAVDNGSVTNKITIGNYNESATATAKTYAEQAQAAAQAAAESENLAQHAKEETENLISSAQSIEATVEAYAGEAHNSANSALSSANAAASRAQQAANSAALAAEYARGVSEYAAEAKSWAVGNTGTRIGEDTDNSMYYCSVASTAAQDALESEANAAISEANAATYMSDTNTMKEQVRVNAETIYQDVAIVSSAKTDAVNAANTASNAKTDAVQAANDAQGALAAINALLNDPHFTIDFTTGELMYDSGMFNFQVNTTTGNLEWEVA